MRVHELAKELNLASKDLVAKIQSMGGTVKGHMSLVEDSLIPQVRAAYASKTPEEKTSEKPKKETPASPGAGKKPEKPAAPVVPEPKKAFSETKPVAVQPSQHSAPKIQTQKPVPVPASTPAVVIKKPEIQDESNASYAIRFPITVGNLAAEIGQSVSAIIKALMAMGIFANVNQLLNEEVAMSLAEVLKIELTKLKDEAEEILSRDTSQENPSVLKLRPPVVTMMGHVDHGKTSLLDAIRKTNVAATEKGAITQHIGAYGVDIPGKGHVTFLDTPGHEAFTAMRARGANITDVVILVVAADDGMMPQTVEAVDHAREAGCPIVVAINKVDLPTANVQKVKGELQKSELTPEDWGGKTICVEVSAKTGQGIPELLDLLLLQSEVMELKANPSCEATGTVIEAHLTKGSGPLATVIVQRGTLRVGDIVVCGVHFGRVRALKNDRGKQVPEASPSYAVSVLGLSGVPEAGDTFMVVADEKVARRITEKRALEKRERELSGANKHLSLENLYEKISEGDFKELKLIIKADVQGSMQALVQSLEKVSNDQCQVRVIHSGTGAINESDVMLAAASDAVVIGFHVRADNKAEALAEKEGVELRYYGIIYEAIEEVRKAMEGLLEPTYTEVVDGKAEVRQVFRSSKVGTIGGAYVTKGKIIRNHQARVVRQNVIVFDGKLSSLKRFKEDARDVSQGYECGVALDGFNDLQIGDFLETYHFDKVATKLSK